MRFEKLSIAIATAVATLLGGILASYAANLPNSTANGGTHPHIYVSLTFNVTVCLDASEYSIACRERALQEAAKRLEQIYLDVYTKGRVAGSLQIQFALALERGQQIEFLRTVEDRAISAVAAKLEHDIDQHGVPKANASAAGDTAATSQRVLQQLRAWRDAAAVEARTGLNWAHAGRSHAYRESPALRQLANVNKPSDQNRGQDSAPITPGGNNAFR